MALELHHRLKRLLKRILALALNIEDTKIKYRMKSAPGNQVAARKAAASDIL
jgi:hypothetical protein